MIIISQLPITHLVALVVGPMCMIISDSTLTVSSLTSLLDSVSNWDDLFKWLNIPHSKFSDIMKHHPDVTDSNMALCEWYLTNHPAPSWGHIAQGLYGTQKHEVLEVLQVHYLKGERGHDTL